MDCKHAENGWGEGEDAGTLPAAKTNTQEPEPHDQCETTETYREDRLNKHRRQSSITSIAQMRDGQTAHGGTELRGTTTCTEAGEADERRGWTSSRTKIQSQTSGTRPPDTQRFEMGFNEGQLFYKTNKITLFKWLVTH